MAPTCGSGVTAAAGTGIAHHLFIKLFSLDKSLPNGKHWGFPYHACAHCKGFLAAAPLRARTRISVSFSGLGLSSPLLISGLVSRYLTNSLISRRLILQRCLLKKARSSINLPSGFNLTFARISQTVGQINDVLLSLSPVFRRTLDLHALVESP